MEEQGRDTQAYWTKRNEQLAEKAQADAEYAASLNGRLHKALVAKSAAQELGGEYLVKAEAELAMIDEEIKATAEKGQINVDTEWTREVTIARRQAWNTAVKDSKYSPKGTVLVGMIQKDLGYSVEALKRQVRRHGL